jgi:hypothetical protein
MTSPETDLKLQLSWLILHPIVLIRRIVSGADEEKMSIAKFVTISYATSPIICFAVVGSLKASVALSS